MTKNLIFSLFAIGVIASCTDDQPIYSASELDGYYHELYQMYDKKNQMLVLMGSQKSEIERDEQAQLAFIHEELNADSNSCRDFLKEQMQFFSEINVLKIPENLFFRDSLFINAY